MYWVFSCFQRIIVLNPKDGGPAHSQTGPGYQANLLYHVKGGCDNFFCSIQAKGLWEAMP